jgi:hypothetical protein
VRHKSAISRFLDLWSQFHLTICIREPEGRERGRRAVRPRNASCPLGQCLPVNRPARAGIGGSGGAFAPSMGGNAGPPAPCAEAGRPAMNGFTRGRGGSRVGGGR